LYAHGDALSVIDPLGLFGWRDAAGFVPILGSGLDAYDAYKCGNYGMMALNIGLMALDMTGAGALVKGLAVGTMKLAARNTVRQAYRNSANWNSMRNALQRAGEVVRNTRAIPNRDWLTTDHIFIKQRLGWPHWITNHPANLQTNVPKWLNSSFEFMPWYRRAAYLPTWMKTTAVGAGSYATGLFVGSGSEPASASGSSTSTPSTQCGC
jgi:hypothetical protein